MWKYTISGFDLSISGRYFHELLFHFGFLIKNFIFFNFNLKKIFKKIKYLQITQMFSNVVRSVNANATNAPVSQKPESVNKLRSIGEMWNSFWVRERNFAAGYN